MIDRLTSNGAGTLAIGGVPLAPHDHLCAFYHGRDERDQLLLTFLSDGLLMGEGCLYLTGEDEGAEVANVIEDGELLQIIGASQFLRDGVFPAAPLLDALSSWSRATFDRDGRPFGRMASDMNWMQSFQSSSFIVQLLDYETKVTLWAAAYPQVGVCLYDLDLLAGLAIVSLIKIHPKVWTGGRVIVNPCLNGFASQS